MRNHDEIIKSHTTLLSREELAAFDQLPWKKEKCENVYDFLSSLDDELNTRRDQWRSEIIFKKWHTLRLVQKTNVK